MMNFERCSKDYYGPIAVEEKRRRFRIQNTEKEYIKKVEVDGCLIDDERIRCDYLFEIGQTCYCVIYLELKGHDIEHAFRQLVATMGYLVNRHKVIKNKICHIVASRVPRAGPKVQVLGLQMAKKHGALLYVGTREVTINIAREPYRKPSSD